MNHITRIGYLTLLALPLTACGGSGTTPLEAQATATPQTHDVSEWLAPLAYERTLLEAYFEARAAAFEEGTETGVRFLVDHNLAGLGATVDGCTARWFGDHPNEHVREIITPKWSTLRRDPSWAMPVGPRAGEVLGDDIFVIEIGQELMGDQFLSASHQSQMHIQIHGSGVRNLVLCEQVATVQVPKPVETPSAVANQSAQPYPGLGIYPPGYLPTLPVQPTYPLPPSQPPVRPSAPVVLPPIQATGRPVVRPTTSTKPSPSQSPSVQPTPTQSARPFPSSQPSTPVLPSPTQPEPSQPAPTVQPSPTTPAGQPSSAGVEPPRATTPTTTPSSSS